MVESAEIKGMDLVVNCKNKIKHQEQAGRRYGRNQKKRDFKNLTFTLLSRQNWHNVIEPLSLLLVFGTVGTWYKHFHAASLVPSVEVLGGGRIFVR